MRRLRVLWATALPAAFAFSACAAAAVAEPAGHAAPPADRRPLLTGSAARRWTPSGFGGDGPVALAGGVLELGIGAPLTGVTWQGPLPFDPARAYAIELRATRLDGDDFFVCLTFPVGGGHASLILGGWGGALCGLSCIDGLDAAANATTTYRRFDAGTEVAVRLDVGPQRVRAAVDGEPIIDVAVPGHRWSVRPEVERSRPFGLASYATATSIRDLVVEQPAPGRPADALAPGRPPLCCAVPARRGGHRQ